MSDIATEVQKWTKAKNLTEKDVDILYIKPSEMIVDLTYQRDPKRRMPTLRKIAAEFDIRRVGAFHVRVRPEGEIAVIDGAGRRFVMMEMLKRNDLVTCINHKHIKSKEDEAKWFVLLNPPTVIKVGKPDTFKAAVASGSIKEVKINKEATKEGFVVGGGGLNAVPVQSALFMDALDLIGDTIRIKKEAWKDHKLPNPLWVALAAFLFACPQCDKRRLVEALRTSPPKVLEANAKEKFGTWNHARTGSVRMAMYIEFLYNKKMRLNKISPQWYRVDTVAEEEGSRWMYDQWEGMGRSTS